MILLLLALSAASASWGYLLLFRHSVNELVELKPADNIDNVTSTNISAPSISVIIPAFNERLNIYSCVHSVLTSTTLPAGSLDVWVVDDRSTDDTLEILESYNQQQRDPRLNLIKGNDLPPLQPWSGKNWACYQAAEQAKGEYLLFIDADVRLEPGAIEALLYTAKTQHVDLLNFIPGINCGSSMEWIVQPLMFINLLISLTSWNVKNPKSDTAYALGAIMLFNRSVYLQIGGHHAVASQIAEDVALARLIKNGGFQLAYRFGSQFASLRMYNTWHSLWEGWTKILYVGAQRNAFMIILLAVVMVVVYTLPWLLILMLVVHKEAVSYAPYEMLIASICLFLAILSHYFLRQCAGQILNHSSRYWWLSGLGGLLIALMAIVSIVKTETGWGWTWRGRSLKQLT
jgi:glycosyltransferase involved in cell wall biosynthesis